MDDGSNKQSDDLGKQRDDLGKQPNGLGKQPDDLDKQSNDLEKELTEEITTTTPVKSRAIVDIDPEWPWYKIMFFNIINGLPIIIGSIIVYFVLTYFSQNPELVYNRDMTLNISIWTTTWGIFAELCFLTFLSWFFYLFSFKRVQASAPIVQAACYIMWGLFAIGGAMIISAGIR